MRAFPVLYASGGGETVAMRPAGADRGIVFLTITCRNMSVTPPGGFPSKVLPQLFLQDLDSGDWVFVYGGPIDGTDDLEFTFSGGDEGIVAGVWVPDATRVQAFGLSHNWQYPTPRFDVVGEAVIVEGYNSANSPSLAALPHPVAPLTGGAYGISPNLTRTHVSYAPKGARGRYGGHAVPSGWSSQVDYVYTAVIQ